MSAVSFKPRSRWRVSEEVDRFAAAVGVASSYRVHSLPIPSSDDERVHASFVDMFERVISHGLGQLGEGRNVILFIWDVVYSTLTVVATDRKRSSDGPDVFKLFCTGWDKTGSQGEGFDDALRETNVQRWLKSL